MFQKIAFLILFLCSAISFSQNTISLKGKIIDKNTSIPLESATIYLKSVKDSTLIDYTISDKNGNFTIKTKKNENAILFKISYIGYNDYSEKIENLKADKDFGSIRLEENVSSLKEVVIQSEAPPVTIKNDTLEFNASSFKVRPDANVEALLKQLPGVEIDEEGKITVNGKEVNNILVNGKPFFGKDGKIATQNLPAEIISKVQVTDTKTKEEELSGQDATSDEKTINLTIQEDKNKGVFGKANVGYGTEERYESSMLFNYFKDTQKISVLGSSNNVNSIGFSMDEIFDNMGGGRNRSIWVNDNGSFGINGMQFGGNNGITTSNMIGVNFADEWAKKKINPNGSYYYSNAETNNNNRTNRINLLPTGNTNTLAESKTKSITDGHNIAMDFEIKLDSTATLYISPSFSKSEIKNKNTGFDATFDGTGAALNENTSDNNWSSQNNSFKNNIYFYKGLKKKGRGISASLNNENSKNDSDLITKTTTTFFQSGNTDDDRNQFRIDNSKDDSFRAEIGYNEPLKDSITLNFETSYSYKKSRDVRETYDFDNGLNSYSNYNDLLSNDIISSTSSVTPMVGISLRKKKIRGSISMGTEIINFNNQSTYLSNKTAVNKNYMYPKMNGYLSITLGKSKSFYTYYSYEVNLPSANQILPFENLANPLNTVIGNADLKPNERYSLYTNFNNYDYATKSGFYAYAGGNYNVNQIASSTTYDSDFKATTTYQNIDRAYNTYVGFSLNKSVKKEKRTFKYGVGLQLGYNYDQGLTNAELFESKGLTLNPRANMSWSIDEMITISPSYRYTYITNDFTNYIIDNTKNFKHSAKIEITSYWPKKVVLGSDFGYNYNSNIADGFQKDFYLWNLSLGYNFFQDKLLAKVKVYDVLNQNISTTRTITPTAITDMENTVLQQYAMFSLTYKLEKFGGKKKEGGIMIID
ncbi:outer membrane beta-barrel protein [Flavobacterium sp. LMO8]|uniref:outer membrane beta-barrel protein n=1 Tax=Flavobacterium sp. LMO8 TaxID=2654244 RepID=UPI0012918D2D|nr:outer membrane beta-barrel protein [Flavobacterium sp. LMO8]MQP25514.1 outer membrane beta-barrel protein [Flavobacterium sp. LMO8]